MATLFPRGTKEALLDCIEKGDIPKLLSIAEKLKDLENASRDLKNLLSTPTDEEIPQKQWFDGLDLGEISASADKEKTPEGEVSWGDSDPEEENPTLREEENPTLREEENPTLREEENPTLSEKPDGEPKWEIKKGKKKPDRKPTHSVKGDSCSIMLIPIEESRNAITIYFWHGWKYRSCFPDLKQDDLIHLTQDEIDVLKKCPTIKPNEVKKGKFLQLGFNDIDAGIQAIIDRINADV